MMFTPPQSSAATPVLLPHTTTTPEVVALCRHAGLAFVNGAERWSKRHLTDWLSGAYRDCAGAGRTSSGSWSPIPLLEEIDARMVVRLLQVSSAEVRDVLTKVAAEGGHSFGAAMRDSDLVRPCRDLAGRIGYVPTYGARRLAEMVLALFGADYLTRPSDYELELSMCRYCGTTDFDLEARTRGHCERHESAFGLRRFDGTMTLLPEGA